MIHFFKKLSAALQANSNLPTTRITVDDESIKLFHKVIGECETSLFESQKHLAKVVVRKMIAKREGDLQQLEQLERHERNINLVIKNTVNTLGHYRSELDVAIKANMLCETSNNTPELSIESITKMQQSLNRLRSRQNNSDTVFG